MNNKWLVIVMAIALVAVLAVGSVVFSDKIKNENEAQTKITDLQGQVTKISGERDTTNASLKTTQETLKQAQDDLTTTRTQVTDLEGRVNTLTGERDDANTALTAKSADYDQLAKENEANLAAFGLERQDFER